MDLSKLKAIDVHVHAEVSCHDPEDPVMAEFFDAASAYFKAPRERPKIPEIIELYREAQIGFCLFTVDAESGMGAKRVSNYEIAEYAAIDHGRRRCTTYHSLRLYLRICHKCA